MKELSPQTIQELKELNADVVARIGKEYASSDRDDYLLDGLHELKDALSALLSYSKVDTLS